MAIPLEAVATNANNSETKLPELIKDYNDIWKQHTMMTKKQPLGHHSVCAGKRKNKEIHHKGKVSFGGNLIRKKFKGKRTSYLRRASYLENQASFTSSPLCKTTAIRIEAFIRTRNSQILPWGKGLFSSPEVSATNRRRACTFPGGGSYLFWHFCYQRSPW